MLIWCCMVLFFLFIRENSEDHKQSYRLYPRSGWWSIGWSLRNVSNSVIYTKNWPRPTINPRSKIFSIEKKRKIFGVTSYNFYCLIFSIRFLFLKLIWKKKITPKNFIFAISRKISLAFSCSHEHEQSFNTFLMI